LKKSGTTMDEANTKDTIQRHAEAVERGDLETVARIHYAGDTSEVTIQSHWRDIDGRPRIVQAGPVA
jgi:hypothetical protein